MPWVDPIELCAKPPCQDEQNAALEDWSGELESGPDGGLIEGYVVAGGVVDAIAAEGLAIVDSEVSGTDFVTDHRHPLDLRGSTLRDCDLSGARIRSMRSVTVIGSRLSEQICRPGRLVTSFSRTAFSSTQTWGTASYPGLPLSDANWRKPTYVAQSLPT